MPEYISQSQHGAVVLPSTFTVIFPELTIRG